MSRSVRGATPMGRLIGVLALASIAQQAGCSTTYQPRQPGHVGLVVRHAAILYVKDGHDWPVGPFGGDLEHLVADSPAAAAHARTAHTQLEIGIPGYLLGAAGIVVGALALTGPVGWVVIGAGTTHVIDAVNIHNDALETATPQ